MDLWSSTGVMFSNIPLHKLRDNSFRHWNKPLNWAELRSNYILVQMFPADYSKLLQLSLCVCLWFCHKMEYFITFHNQPLNLAFSTKPCWYTISLITLCSGHTIAPIVSSVLHLNTAPSSQVSRLSFLISIHSSNYNLLCLSAIITESLELFGPKTADYSKSEIKTRREKSRWNEGRWARPSRVQTFGLFH